VVYLSLHTLMQMNPKPPGGSGARRVVVPRKEEAHYGTEEPQGHPLVAVRRTHRHTEKPQGGGVFLPGTIGPGSGGS